MKFPLIMIAIQSHFALLRKSVMSHSTNGFFIMDEITEIINFAGKSYFIRLISTFALGRSTSSSHSGFSGARVYFARLLDTIIAGMAAAGNSRASPTFIPTIFEFILFLVFDIFSTFLVFYAVSLSIIFVVIIVNAKIKNILY